MQGFIFDYNGTLNRLPNPVGFLEALRVKHPESGLFLYTGTTILEIEGRHPGITKVLDAWVIKPDAVHTALKDLGFSLTSVTYSDDDRFLISAVKRMFRPIPCVIVAPEDLLQLI